MLGPEKKGPKISNRHACICYANILFLQIEGVDKRLPGVGADFKAAYVADPVIDRCKEKEDKHVGAKYGEQQRPVPSMDHRMPPPLLVHLPK